MFVPALNLSSENSQFPLDTPTKACLARGHLHPTNRQIEARRNPFCLVPRRALLVACRALMSPPALASRPLWHGLGNVGRNVGTCSCQASLLPSLPPSSPACLGSWPFLTSAVCFLQLGLCPALQGGRTEGRLGARSLRRPFPSAEPSSQLT